MSYCILLIQVSDIKHKSLQYKLFTKKSNFAKKIFYVIQIIT